MDLETLNKIQEVEKDTGQSVLSIYSKVPFGNVVTAFREIPVSDLVDMNNVAKLQEKFSERSIIIAISKMSYRRLQELLERNNLDVMIDAINRNAFLNN